MKTPLGGVPFQAESIEQNMAKMFLIKANNFNLILCMLFFHAFVVICYFSKLTFSSNSGISVWYNFSDSEYPCYPDAPNKFWFHPTYVLGDDDCRISRWLSWRFYQF